jgi:hypothetical protein
MIGFVFRKYGINCGLAASSFTMHMYIAIGKIVKVQNFKTLDLSDEQP